MEKLFRCYVRFGKRSRDNPCKNVSGVELTSDGLVINFSRHPIAIPERFARFAYDSICNYGSLLQIPFSVSLSEVIPGCMEVSYEEGFFDQCRAGKEVQNEED